MTLFDHVFEQRRVVYLVVALLAGLGVRTALTLPSSVYPELHFLRLTVIAQGPPLDPGQVVFAVTRPIEEAVSTVPGVERVRSRTIRGACEVSVSFSEGTDMLAAQQLVEGRVAEIRGELPPDLSVIVERMLPSLFPILTYSLTGTAPEALYDLARYTLKPQLSRVPGVGRVDIQAGDVREVQVVADPERLADLGLGYAGLAEALETQLSVAAVGRLDREYRQHLVVVQPPAATLDDVRDVVVRPGVRVGDIARVSFGREDATSLIRGDGRPGVLINVSRQPDGSALAVADSVAHILAGVELPAGAELRVAYDQAALVRESVRSVRDAMALGAILVTGVLLLFLGDLRLTLLSASAIPLTMTLTVFLMGLLGQTFNLMSLGGMAVAIGLVIDDAVVVTEDIARHLSAGSGRREAVSLSLAELVVPVTTSTLTTVVVFLPLGFLKGVVGQFFAAFSMTLAASVLVSLVLALTLIPLLAHRWIRPRESERTSPVERTLGRLDDGYARALAGSLRHPGRALAVGALLILVGALTLTRVGTGFLPLMDEGAFVLDYFTPGGTALAETDRELRQVEALLAATPEVAATARRTGAEMGLFATESNAGDLAVRLVPSGDRDRSVFEVIDDVRGRIEATLPRLRIEFIQLISDEINDLAGNPEPVEIKLFGDRMAGLEAYGRALAAALEPVPGLVDLYDGVPELTPQTRLVIDRTAAAAVGLTSADVELQVRGALLGVEAGQLREEDRVVAIRVRAPDRTRGEAARLASLPLFSPGAPSSTPLGAVASLRDTTAPVELLRENQAQMLALTAGVEGRSLGAVMTDVKDVLAANPPPPGVRYELGGQYLSQQEAFRSLLTILGLATLLVVTVMLAQFRSLVEPVAIVAAAPLSFVGAVLLLLVTGTQLDVASFMGMILLVGLVVKNGILLLDFSQRRMATSHEGLEEALLAAARTRLRPILMTTLCTLLGLLPLALGIGAGSEMQKPLALAVVGGLTLSTPLTLFGVPTLTALLHRRRMHHAV